MSILKQFLDFQARRGNWTVFASISKMAGLAIVAFTITWLPYCAYALVSAFGGSHLIDTNTGLIACLVAKSSILYNPFIYALVNPRYVCLFNLYCCSRIRFSLVFQLLLVQLAFISLKILSFILS